MANINKIDHDIKTPVVDLKWVIIKGEGVNTAQKGQPARMQYVATAEMVKDSAEHKALLKSIDEVWKEYKSEFGVKGLPKTNGIRPVMQDDPSGEIDPATEKVKRIETDRVAATFKTNIAWPDGNPQIVQVLGQKNGVIIDLTDKYRAAQWTISNESKGIIHGIASANDVGGNDKVSFYLSGVQLTKLDKYTGSHIEAEVVETAEDIDMDDIDASIENDEADEEKPKL